MNRLILLLAVMAVAVGCGGAKKSSTATGAAPPPSMTKHRSLDDRMSAGGDNGNGASSSVTAEEVLRLYVEATGGRAAYEKLTSRVVKGVFSVPANAIKGPIELFTQAPNKMYMKATIGSVGTIERGTNGVVVWESNAMTGARVLKGTERATTLLQSTFNAELKWKTLYKSVELAGSAKVDGSDAYKLVFTSQAGEKETRFFDKESKLLVKSEAMVKNQMGTINTVTVFSDYREVDGVRVAHKMVTKAVNATQVLTMTEVKHNVAIPASRFAIPAKIQKLLDKKPAGTK